MPSGPTPLTRGPRAVPDRALRNTSKVRTPTSPVPYTKPHAFAARRESAGPGVAFSGVIPLSQVAQPSSAETIAQFEKYVIPNYRRYPVCLVRGEGSWVWDAEGNRY